MNFENLPDNFFKKLTQFLTFKDLINLSRTCRILYQKTSDDKIWKTIFEKIFKNLCSLKLYNKVCIEGEYKNISHQVFKENKKYALMKNLIKSDDLFIGYSNAKFNEKHFQSLFHRTPFECCQQNTRNLNNSLIDSIKKPIIDSRSYTKIPAVTSFNIKNEEKQEDFPINLMYGQRRLNLLKINVAKNPSSSDDFLPGDKTKKYALRYRQ